MAIDDELKAQILRYHFVEHWRVGTIASQLGVHHSTVERVLGEAGVERERQRPRRPSKLDSYMAFITETLERFPTLSAARLFDMVTARGYPLRVLAPFESDDKIIAVAHQHRLASKARLHLALEPHVQCVMQVQVPQQRRESRPLRGSPLGLRPLLSVQHSYADTLSDQPPQRPIGHPNLEHLLKPGAVQTVEEGLNVSLQNPTHLALVHRSVQRTNRIVGTASRPETVRALQKILLVHRLQHLAHRLLDYLVLHCRYPYRPRPSASLGDVHSPQRLMPVPLRPQPPVQVLKIPLQSLLVLRLAHPVHPHRRVSAQSMKGTLQRRHIDQMRQ